MEIKQTSMQKKAALKAAFPFTLPVMAGYLFLGVAFGMLLQSNGYGLLWSFFMSLSIYAGSMQFVAAGLLTGAFSPLVAVTITLMVNARHLFYGLSMLEPFRDMGRKKPYMIFALTDETYSLLCGLRLPKDINEKQAFFYISLLNQCYWVTGSMLGSLFGQWLPIDAKGIDFAMTALFVVIFTEQWLGAGKRGKVLGFFKAHGPALIGAGVSLLCLLIFGPNNFLLPAMGLMLILFAVLKKPLTEGSVEP